MALQPGGRHRRPHRRRRPAVVFGVVAVVIAVVAVSITVHVLRGGREPLAAHQLPTGGRSPSNTAAPDRPSTSAPSTTAPSTTAPSTTAPSDTAAAGTSPSARPAVVTRGGMWWGVDSTEPISRATIANVAGWYRGAHPQFWGRYLLGSYAVTPSELAFARTRHIYVFLIVNDRNCSGCAGGDACGNDETSSQAQDDAREAIRRADRLHIPAGTVLFKDIEQVSSCRGEPSSDYLLAWYRTLLHTHYRTGFYGNTFRPYYDFPVGYCKAVAASPRFAADVVLDMNEPEPRLGAPRGTTGPHNAPAFRPSEPPCTPSGKTVIWQYGESVDADNLTDIDQAVPGTPGFLAPDGSAT